MVTLIPSVAAAELSAAEQNANSVATRTTGVIPDGYYYIRNRRTEKFMDYYASGSRAIQWDLHGDTNQVWRVMYNPPGEYYTISPLTSTSRKLYQSQTGAFVGYNDETEARWEITSLSNGYYKITNVDTTQALCAPISGTGDAANFLTMGYYSYRDVFMWEFVKKFVKGNPNETGDLSDPDDLSQETLTYEDFFSSNDGTSLYRAFGIMDKSEDWQETKIRQAAAAWTDAGSHSGLSVEIRDDADTKIWATEGNHRQGRGNLGRYDYANGDIYLYYDNIVSYVRNKSPNTSESTIQSRIQTVYKFTTLHELGHAFGLGDNPTGTDRTANPPTAYTIMRYAQYDGYCRWESYWGQTKPQMADIVGVLHPNV